MGLTKHGLCRRGKEFPLYGVWRDMKSRCGNPNVDAFKDYGGRGIAVCEEWEKDFKVFHEWAMGNGWERGLQIDRKDNSSGYNPDNCKIAAPSQNCMNRRNSRLLTLNGITKNISRWERDLGLGKGTIRSRLLSGHTLKSALMPIVEEVNG